MCSVAIASLRRLGYRYPIRVSAQSPNDPDAIFHYFLISTLSEYQNITLKWAVCVPFQICIPYNH